MLKRKLISLLLSYFLALSSHIAFAQSDFTASLDSITPEASDVSDSLGFQPPGKIKLFLYQGTPNVEYTAVFSVSAEPALVVGVGANISSMSFDSSSNKLTIVFTYDRSPDSGGYLELPGNSFVLSFDPGSDSSSPQSLAVRTKKNSSLVGSRAINQPENDKGRECYGPGSGGKRQEDEGQEGGSPPPGGQPPEGEPPPEGEEEGGPPFEARGTYLSTNIFNWALCPPETSEPEFGFRLAGPKGTSGFFKMFLSQGLLEYLSTISGKEVSASTLAVFNGKAQATAAGQVTEVNGGALVSVFTEFKAGNTLVTPQDPMPQGAAIFETKSATQDQDPSDIRENFIKKELFIKPGKPFTFAPQDFKDSGKKIEFYGFLDDPELVGRKVLIQKKISKGKFKTISKTTVGEDLSYGLTVKRNKLLRDDFGRGPGPGPRSNRFAAFARTKVTLRAIIRNSSKSAQRVTLSLPSRRS